MAVLYNKLACQNVLVTIGLVNMVVRRRTEAPPTETAIAYNVLRVYEPATRARRLRKQAP